jgi:hypothetical protein
MRWVQGAGRRRERPGSVSEVSPTSYRASMKGMIVDSIEDVVAHWLLSKFDARRQARKSRKSDSLQQKLGDAKLRGKELSDAQRQIAQECIGVLRSAKTPQEKAHVRAETKRLLDVYARAAYSNTQEVKRLEKQLRKL